jgi:hypothetical protein
MQLFNIFCSKITYEEISVFSKVKDFISYVFCSYNCCLKKTESYCEEEFCDSNDDDFYKEFKNLGNHDKFDSDKISTEDRRKNAL